VRLLSHFALMAVTRRKFGAQALRTSRSHFATMAGPARAQSFLGLGPQTNEAARAAAGRQARSRTALTVFQFRECRDAEGLLDEEVREAAAPLHGPAHHEDVEPVPTDHLEASSRSPPPAAASGSATGAGRSRRAWRRGRVDAPRTGRAAPALQLAQGPQADTASPPRSFARCSSSPRQGLAVPARASKSTLPLWIQVRTRSHPRRAKARDSASIVTGRGRRRSRRAGRRRSGSSCVPGA